MSSAARLWSQRGIGRASAARAVATTGPRVDATAPARPRHRPSRRRRAASPRDRAARIRDRAAAPASAGAQLRPGTAPASAGAQRRPAAAHAQRRGVASDAPPRRAPSPRQACADATAQPPQPASVSCGAVSNALRQGRTLRPI
jgi:hypothetical protein